MAIIYKELDNGQRAGYAEPKPNSKCKHDWQLTSMPGIFRCTKCYAHEDKLTA